MLLGSNSAGDSRWGNLGRGYEARERARIGGRSSARRVMFSVFGFLDSPGATMGSSEAARLEPIL
jgi:hypothetical protein